MIPTDAPTHAFTKYKNIPQLAKKKLNDSDKWLNPTIRGHTN